MAAISSIFMCSRSFSWNCCRVLAWSFNILKYKAKGFGGIDIEAHHGSRSLTLAVVIANPLHDPIAVETVRSILRWLWGTPEIGSLMMSRSIERSLYYLVEYWNGSVQPDEDSSKQVIVPLFLG